MAKITIEKIIEGKIHDFKTNFVKTSRNIFSDGDRLIHSSEFGINREIIVKDFINHFITPEYNIGTGFISSKNGINSHQCDIIITHKAHTPVLRGYYAYRLAGRECLLLFFKSTAWIKSEDSFLWK